MGGDSTITWKRMDGNRGHSLVHVASNDGGHRFTACEVLAGPEARFACWFWVEVDAGWLTRAVEVRVAADDGVRAIDLTADDDRQWTVDGELRGDLNGCVDVDVASTPVTNTFPIRRIGHAAIGQAFTAPVAWVDVPSLAVRRVEQTYRWLGSDGAASVWEYGDAAHGSFRLLVDGDGLVIDYQGFATRTVD